MQPKPGDGVFGIVVACASLCALALPFVGLPPISARPWLLAAAFFNVLYWRALMAAYDRTGFEPPQSGAPFGLAVVVAALLLLPPRPGGCARRISPGCCSPPLPAPRSRSPACSTPPAFA